MEFLFFLQYLVYLQLFLLLYYSFKSIYLVFLVAPRATKKAFENMHESSLTLLVPLIVLSLFAVFFGEISVDAFLSPTFWKGALSDFNFSAYLYDSEFLPSRLKLLPFYFY